MVTAFAILAMFSVAKHEASIMPHSIVQLVSDRILNALIQDRTWRNRENGTWCEIRSGLGFTLLLTEPLVFLLISRTGIVNLRRVLTIYEIFFEVSTTAFAFIWWKDSNLNLHLNWLKFETIQHLQLSVQRILILSLTSFGSTNQVQPTHSTSLCPLVSLSSS